MSASVFSKGDYKRQKSNFSNKQKKWTKTQILPRNQCKKAFFHTFRLVRMAYETFNTEYEEEEDYCQPTFIIPKSTGVIASRQPRKHNFPSV